MHRDGRVPGAVLNAVDANLIVGVGLLARDVARGIGNATAEGAHLYGTKRATLARDVATRVLARLPLELLIEERQVELYLVHLTLNGTHPTTGFVVTMDGRASTGRPAHQEHLHLGRRKHHIAGVGPRVGRVDRDIGRIFLGPREPASNLAADATHVVLGHAVYAGQSLFQRCKQRAKRMRLWHERATVGVKWLAAVGDRLERCKHPRFELGTKALRLSAR
mmetsp:Transcript_30773/g.94308  ORF Transcript_30773/g.94308 Transcript_30773/m.94308 type:complete len:221 (+) Transcript_30773:757-1419(+)